MKKWPLYFILILVVIQKNNFENWIASCQIIYKNIHHGIQHFSEENSIQIILSQEAFLKANIEEQELFHQQKWYDIQTIQSLHADSVLVKCTPDDWDTQIAQWLNVIKESGSADSKSSPCYSATTKSWNFETIPFPICSFENYLTAKLYYVALATLFPENPWIKITTPPPLFN